MGETSERPVIKEELTYDERSVFCFCKICGAEPGKKCNDKNFEQKNGVHLGRLIAAPKFRIITFH